MELADAADILGIIRDGLLILIFLLAVIVLLVAWRKVSAVLNSLRRVAKSMEEITDAVSSKIAKPAAAGSGVAFGLGKMAAFVAGFGKNKNQGGEEDGK